MMSSGEILRMKWLAFALGLSAWFGAIVLLTSAQESGVVGQSLVQEVSLSRVQAQTIFSEALQRGAVSTVFLPPGYDSETTRRYPVLYMLHGLGGDREEWQRYGLFQTAERMILDGEIEPMIIVTPDGDSSYWMDQPAKGQSFGTYVSRDLVQAVDLTYRTIAEPEARAIGGVSMGGHGALQLALNAPGVFAVVGAHSAALRTIDQALPVFGDASRFASVDPVRLYQERTEQARRLKIWIDIGSDDRWLPAALAFHELLSRVGVAHQWQVPAGGHDESYWKTNVAQYLRFYDSALVDHPASQAAWLPSRLICRAKPPFSADSSFVMCCEAVCISIADSFVSWSP